MEPYLTDACRWDPLAVAAALLGYVLATGDKTILRGQNPLRVIPLSEQLPQPCPALPFVALSFPEYTSTELITPLSPPRAQTDG